MIHPADRGLLRMASEAGARSVDRSTRVGCALVTKTNVFTACNGFPRGVQESETRHARPAKYLYFEHAERNVIYAAAKLGASTQGATLYMASTMPGPPCCDCTRACIQAGVERVVCSFSGDPLTWREDWRASMLASVEMLQEAGVSLEFEVTT